MSEDDGIGVRYASRWTASRGRLVQLRPDAADHERRSCSDCAHARSALSWWCTNRQAIEEHGTAMCGRVRCAHWAPPPVLIPTSQLTWVGRALQWLGCDVAVDP